MSLYELASAVRGVFRRAKTDRPTETIYGKPLEDERAARIAMSSLLRRASDEAKIGKDPRMVLGKIYTVAEGAGISTEDIDRAARRLMNDETADTVMDTYREVVDRERLQSAETQPIDVRKLIGEAEPVTA